jgi:hypothetical protein
MGVSEQANIVRIQYRLSYLTEGPIKLEGVELKALFWEKW